MVARSRPIVVAGPWPGSTTVSSSSGRTTSLLDGLRIGFPLPALALFLLAVPAGKLLLAGAPSTAQWLAQGPRVRERRADPAATHRGLCVATLCVIGLALTATALLVAPPADGGSTTPASVSSH